jgi:hypothetical protein
MTEALSGPFVSYPAEILADTNLGLSGPQIVKTTVAYAVDYGVTVPHSAYPFDAPNKRAALLDNLRAFSEHQRYRIIRELCDHPAVIERNPQAAQKLKLQLIARYGHLAGEALGSELDEALIQRTRHWLNLYPEVLALYNDAIQKHANGMFLRNVLDDLRLALEKLLRALLNNTKSLENQIPSLGTFIKQRHGSPELANMFVKLVDYYTKYQNTYVKHDDAVIEEEVEFVMEITSAFMKHLVRLSYKEAA